MGPGLRPAVAWNRAVVDPRPQPSHPAARPLWLNGPGQQHLCRDQPIWSHQPTRRGFAIAATNPWTQPGGEPAVVADGDGRL